MVWFFRSTLTVILQLCYSFVLFSMVSRQLWVDARAATRNGQTGQLPPRNFCKHDGILVLHLKRYFSRLRYLYVNFFSRQLIRIRVASYWIKLLNNRCTMLPKTPNTDPETSFEALGLKWKHSSRHEGLMGLSPQTKLQAGQIEIWNIINQCNFFQLWMSSSLCTKVKHPRTNAKPLIDDFLATVLNETIRFMKVTLWL